MLPPSLTGPLAMWCAVAVLLVALLAVAFAFGRRRRSARRVDTGGSSAVNGLSWVEFERLVGECFRQRGYTVVESQRGADGGVELKLAKQGHTTIAHCKRWLLRDVGVQSIRELQGAVRSRAKTSGVLVASGGFTAEARLLARQSRIELIDGTMLARALQPRTAAAQLTAE